MEDVNVGDLVERGHVGFQPLNDGLRLLRGAGVGLFDGHRFAGFFLPVCLELLVVGSEQFPGNVVGGVQQLAIGRPCRLYGHKSGQRDAAEEFFHDASHPLLVNKPAI